MDERQLFNKRSVSLGITIKQQMRAPNHVALDNSWFQQRLDFVRRELLKDLRIKVIQTSKAK